MTIDEGEPAADVARPVTDRATIEQLQRRLEVRLGHALILAREITEATQLLANAAPHVHLSPRLTAELHTARARMQPWAHTSAVKTLDSQLHACGLTPGRTRNTSAPVTPG